MSALLENKEQLLMSLVHYFVTIENYSPINVQGVKDEIWLENLEAPYKIIRINSKYIHNNEQYQFDTYKMQHVMKQIKKKTLSLKMNAINICLDLGDSVSSTENKDIECVKAENINDIKKNKLLNQVYPNIKLKIFNKADSLDLIMNVANDINQKTEKENKVYEKIFSSKKIIVTYVLIAICVLVALVPGLNLELANNRELVLNGQVYRLITSAFAHANITHLIVNMYSLYIVGCQAESYFGKGRFLIIYLLSAIAGSLLSIVFNAGYSVGASGAIFGILGCLLYFGYHYRLYLSSVIRSQIIPIIFLNLLIGFLIPGIDNACHIGGLVGGYLATMIVGVPGKSKKSEMINGLIVYILYIAFLVFVLFR